MGKSTIKTSLKYGIIMGLSFCLYTILMWLTKLDSTYLNIGQYLDMLIILLPILVIFKAIGVERGTHKITFMSRVTIAIMVGAVSYLIYEPFLFVYHNNINPEWFNHVLNLRQSTLRATGIVENEIMETITKMKESNILQNKMFKLNVLVASGLVIPFLVSMLSFIFIKNKKLIKTA